MIHHLAPIVSDTPHAVCNMPSTSRTHTYSNCNVLFYQIVSCANVSDMMLGQTCFSVL